LNAIGASWQTVFKKLVSVKIIIGMSTPGTVYLVGAGPGDPGLLTLRGLECLQKADLVLYDGLVNPLLLRHTRAEAERTCRAESAASGLIKQDEINDHLVAAAKAGKTVVRLKGGDPYIFGRGSEEAAALAAAGIPFEVVPGITAATAAAIYAGLSLTHREEASAVAFITGHEDPAKGATVLDYTALANFPGTLVFYMGLSRVHNIATALMSKGKPAETPVAVICRATTPFQKTVQGTLATIASDVKQGGLHAPSLVVVGNCVRLRETVGWFENRPLLGVKIGITRPEDQVDEPIARACALGAQPLVLPTIEIDAPPTWDEVDQSIRQLSRFSWLVFTSANGVRHFMGRVFELGLDARALRHCKLAVIGLETAQSLAPFGLKADLVPQVFRAEGLAEELEPLVAGQEVLWPRANRGRDLLAERLTTAGARVTSIVAYQNRDVAEWPPVEKDAFVRGEIHYVALSSPSIARNFARLATAAIPGGGPLPTKVVSISPVTTEAANEAGLEIAGEAAEHTWDGLFAEITRLHLTAKSE
jgi:uroporphyrinogen III methyltransferase / synthase